MVLGSAVSQQKARQESPKEPAEIQKISGSGEFWSLVRFGQGKRVGDAAAVWLPGAAFL